MVERQVLGSWRIPGPIGVGHAPMSLPVFPGVGGESPRPLSHHKASAAEAERVIPLGKEPKEDGERNTYDVSEYAIFWVPQTDSAGVLSESPPTRQKRKRPKRTGAYKVVFVNGQDGNPSKHMIQACAVAAVSGGPVEGIYNASNGLVVDTLKSIWLKLTSAALMKMETVVLDFFQGKKASENAIRDHLLNRDCPASAALFDLLLQKEYADARLVGHSQGNIVICNAVNGLLACRGDSAVRRMKVFAVASPTVFWERSEIVTVFNMRNDFVGWLSGNVLGTVPAAVMGWSAATSDDSQMVTGYKKERLNVLTHSFYLYLAELWDKLCPLFP